MQMLFSIWSLWNLYTDILIIHLGNYSFEFISRINLSEPLLYSHILFSTKKLLLCLDIADLLLSGILELSLKAKFTLRGWRRVPLGGTWAPYWMSQTSFLSTEIAGHNHLIKWINHSFVHSFIPSISIYWAFMSILHKCWAFRHIKCDRIWFLMKIVSSYKIFHKHIHTHLLI